MRENLSRGARPTHLAFDESLDISAAINELPVKLTWWKNALDLCPPVTHRNAGVFRISASTFCSSVKKRSYRAKGNSKGQHCLRLAMGLLLAARRRSFPPVPRLGRNRNISGTERRQAPTFAEPVPPLDAALRVRCGPRHGPPDQCDVGGPH